MRKCTIDIIEDDAGVVSIREQGPSDESKRFNNSEVVGLLTQFIHGKVSAMNGGGQ